MRALKKALEERNFVCVLEVASQPSLFLKSELKKILQRGNLAGWPVLPSFADRVGQKWEWDSLDGAKDLGNPAASLLHFSGKNRTSPDLLKHIAAMKKKGLTQLLLLSGDRFPSTRLNQKPIRYLESVPALQITREHCPDWFLGAALNPFKYLEEEGYAQYLKAKKKLLAGADFLTVQLGFDFTKHLEAQRWMQTQEKLKPMLACVMRLTKKRAEFLKTVPGIVITESMCQLLEQEENHSLKYAQTRSLERLAQQIIGLKLMGYVGVHVSGLNTQEELLLLEKRLIKEQTRLTSMDAWIASWKASWSMTDLPEVCFTPEDHSWEIGQSNVAASRKEQLRYKIFSTLHNQLFNQTNPLSKAFGWMVTQPLWKSGQSAKVLHTLERKIKKPLLGCDTCGQCRLQDTLYICPETCPKGLANGPCGGTQLNRCEFGDRECIHSVKYRIASSTNQLSVLSHQLIPVIQEEKRHQSSWPTRFEKNQDRPSKKNR